MSGIPARSRGSALAVAAAVAALLTACGTTVPLSQVQSAGGGLSGPSQGQQLGAPGGGASTGEQAAATGGGAGSASSTAGGRGAAGTGARPSGPVASSSSSSGQAVIAKTGPGWDEHNVYVGIVTVTDAPTVGHMLGVNSLDYGDQNGYMSTMFDYVNRHGGVFGRKLTPVAYDVSSTTDPNTSAEAACTKFTQDKRVVAALGAINNGTFFSCMKKAQVPVITDGYGTLFLARDLAKYNGWLYFWHNLSLERMANVWLDRLQVQGYFTGWDTSSGKPGAAPVKVGLVHSNDAYRPEAFAYLKDQLKRRGIVVAAEFQGSSPSDYSGAVLKFRQAGVTHLFLDSTAALFYPTQAENQRYYARYAVTTDSYIQPFLQSTAPAAQLRGMMGIGWLPNQDVDLAHNPGPNAGQAACLKIMRSAGRDVSKDNYQYTAETVCDTLLLFVAMTHKGGGLTPGALLQSVHAAASGFPWASQLGVGIAQTDMTLSPSVRGLEYVSSCSCVQYVGPKINVP